MTKLMSVLRKICKYVQGVRQVRELRGNLLNCTLGNSTFFALIASLFSVRVFIMEFLK